jgi:hypothetical protein
LLSPVSFFPGGRHPCYAPLPPEAVRLDDVRIACQEEIGRVVHDGIESRILRPDVVKEKVVVGGSRDGTPGKGNLEAVPVGG